MEASFSCATSSPYQHDVRPNEAIPSIIRRIGDSRLNLWIEFSGSEIESLVIQVAVIHSMNSLPRTLRTTACQAFDRRSGFDTANILTLINSRGDTQVRSFHDSLGRQH